MTAANDAMLLNTLQELKDGQQRIHDKLDAMGGVQAGHGERLATLEANQCRYITWKHLITAGAGSAGAAGVVTTLLHRLLGG